MGALFFVSTAIAIASHPASYVFLCVETHRSFCPGTLSCMLVIQVTEMKV